MTTRKLSDLELVAIVKRALALIDAKDMAGAARVLSEVPCSQWRYVYASLEGAIADKQAAAAKV
jgi:hypothetical protein